MNNHVQTTEDFPNISADAQQKVCLLFDLVYMNCFLTFLFVYIFQQQQHWATQQNPKDFDRINGKPIYGTVNLKKEIKNEQKISAENVSNICFDYENNIPIKKEIKQEIKSEFSLKKESTIEQIFSRQIKTEPPQQNQNFIPQYQNFPKIKTEQTFKHPAIPAPMSMIKKEQENFCPQASGFATSGSGFATSGFNDLPNPYKTSLDNDILEEPYSEIPIIYEPLCDCLKSNSR